MDNYLIRYLQQFGIYLQALYIQTHLVRYTDHRLALDLDGLEYYGACWFDSNLCYRLLSQEDVEQVIYDIDINLNNVAKIIKPGAVYHLHTDSDVECHYFSLIYFTNSTPLVFSTYGGIPVFSVLQWADPVATLTKILQCDKQAYSDAFNIDHLVPQYHQISLGCNIKPMYIPTFDDIYNIIDDIEKIVLSTDYQQLLADDKRQLEHDLKQDYAKHYHKTKLTKVTDMINQIKSLRRNISNYGFT